MSAEFDRLQERSPMKLEDDEESEDGEPRGLRRHRRLLFPNKGQLDMERRKRVHAKHFGILKKAHADYDRSLAPEECFPFYPPTQEEEYRGGS